MRKLFLVIFFILLFGIACNQNQTVDEGPEIIEALAAEIPTDLEPTRGYRNCELFDLGIDGNQVIINVWNNAGQGHNCPDDWLASIDRALYYVDGPRWQPIDYVLSIDENLNLIFDGSALNDQSPVIREIPEGSGFTMVRAATVELGNVRLLANEFDVTFDNSGNVPPELTEAIFAQLADGTSYEITEVNRTFKTFWVYKAGQPVYVLSDGECEYGMKYYTSAINPLLTSEDAIQDLENLYERMPSDFSYEVRLFHEDVHVLDLDGLQYVLQDEFGNSFDRLWCGGSQVEYTVRN